MNNRQRMIARVYRQNRGLCSNSDFQAIVNSFYPDFFNGINKAKNAICEIGIKALECAKSFDLLSHLNKEVNDERV